MIYDYIIVGAGLGGLTAGLNLAMNDKKVLILEKNSLPGGLVTTFKRGRFEFDTSLYELYDYGNEDKIGSVQKIFEKFGLDIETTLIPFNVRIKALDNKDDYEIKGDIDDFLLELERLKNGSIDSLKEFLKVIKEIHEALKDLENDMFKSEDYPYFNKYLNVNTLDALEDLKIPKDTIHRLGYLWVYIGSPLNKLSFIDFAEFMYKLVFKKNVVLNKKNLDLTLKMANNYQNFGGKIYYRSQVTEIIDLDNVKQVVTKDGKKYKAKHIICNLSKRYVFKNLIKKENKSVNKLENARTLSPNGLIVYLGLNKDYESLGLTNYHYYHYQNLNSTINVKSMANLYHSTWEAIVPNVVNEDASPKNTTILILKTSYMGNVFDNVTRAEYQELKENLANNLIEQFEEAYSLDITEYIEEIEIATPFTLKRYTNNPNGAMKGYMRLGYDNAIHRLISFKDETIPDISFVGGSSIFGGGADNAIYSGYFITEKLLEEV